MTLHILEHTSSSYAPRTYANAASADVTIALAVEYTTTGERLTHKAAGKKYLALPLEDHWIDNAREFYKKAMRAGVVHTFCLNVAGNGIYTLHKHGWSQSQINEYVCLIIEKVHEFFHISKIVSGGQTGVDLAGGYAGYKLGIDTTLLLPKGFKQRHEDGIDVCHTEDEIRKQVMG